MPSLTVPELHHANSVAWGETAGYYRRKNEANAGALRAGRVLLHPLEQRLLKPRVTGRTVVHLQCAAGVETLSLKNLGAAEVTGVDIASELVDLARELAGHTGIAASWRVADVLAVGDDLAESADVVYSGQGALVWIHDLDAWCETVARILRPEGQVVIFDLHAMSAMFDERASQLRPTGLSYFGQRLRTTSWEHSYVAGDAPDAPVPRYSRLWPPSAVVSALLRRGFHLRHFMEHPDAYWDAFPHLPADERRKIACSYSVVATRP